MLRKEIEKIIDDMNKYSDKHSLEILIPALFIWWRLGSLEGINDVQLGMIIATVNKYDTVFSEEIRDEIEEILC